MKGNTGVCGGEMGGRGMPGEERKAFKADVKHLQRSRLENTSCFFGTGTEVCCGWNVTGVYVHGMGISERNCGKR